MWGNGLLLNARQVMRGETLLMAQLLYGCGLRLMECFRLQVKDVDFEQHQIVVRDPKGMHDRTTMLPDQPVYWQRRTA
jgi:site-specific recombinase XerD